MSTPAKKFSLKVKKEEVVISDENGKDQKYEIREMTAKERDSYMDLVNDRVILGPDGKIQSFKKVAGMHADLLTRSLFHNGVAVTREQIDAWPSSVTGELFSESGRINGIQKNAEEAKDAAKKD